MAFVSKIINYINKDTVHENESKRMAVVVRVLSLVIMLFQVVIMAFCAISGVTNGIVFSAIAIAIYGLVFYISYKKKKIVCVSAYIIATLTWCIVNLWLFGWYCGVQTMIIQMILIYYFASYGKLVQKICYSVLTFIIYMAMYVEFSHRTPVDELSQSDMTFLRVIFVMLVIFCMSSVSYLFSNESQEMEDKLVEYNKKLVKKSSTDPLTGLYNRGKAMEILAELEAKSDNETFSLCICDIDFFKKVNDNYGHDVGDKVLIAVSNVLNRIVKEYGYVARWGGEEFLIVFPRTNGDDASTVIYTIQSEIRKTVVMDGDNEIRVTLTYGLTEFDANRPLDQNIKDADNKLYRGKEEGRNRLVY